MTRIARDRYPAEYLHLRKRLLLDQVHSGSRAYSHQPHDSPRTRLNKAIHWLPDQPQTPYIWSFLNFLFARRPALENVCSGRITGWRSAKITPQRESFQMIATPNCSPFRVIAVVLSALLASAGL